MKRLLQIILIVILLFTSNVKAFEINSKNAILINLNEDMVLYEKNSEENTKIASLTKIMTALVVLDKVENLDDKITLTNEDFKGLADAHAAVAGFKVGQTVSYRDLLYGLLLPSGADAALALVRNVAESNEKFVELMNNKAKELKLENTIFVNSTGLDQEGQKSTVKDVSILFKYALKNKEFVKIIKSNSYTTSDQKITFKNGIKSKAKSIGMNYLLGGKTGTTYDAGLCLATIASYNDVDYMLVTTNAPYPSNNPVNYLDAKTIYDYYMNNFSYKILVNKGDKLVTIKTKNSNPDEIIFKADKDIKKYLNNDYKKEDVKLKYEGKNVLSYKNKKGEKVGKVSIYYKDKKIDTVDIILKEKIKFNLKKYLRSNNNIIMIVVFIIIFFIFIKIKFKKKKRKKRKNV